MIESTDNDLDVEKLDDLFRSVDWKPRGADRWEEVLSKSGFVYSLWDADRAIGFGRTLEDGDICVFLDVCVDKKEQGKGLGKKIVERLIEEVRHKGYYSISLIVDEHTPELVSFYEKCGFEKAPQAMELKKYQVR